MPLLAANTNFLRPRDDGHGNAPVTQIELFFDLVFVFAVIQLSAELRAHLTPIGLLHTLILFAAVWWVWVFTSWITNWLDPKHQPVRIMLLGLMFLALLLACAVPNAFGDRGIAFAGAYVAMQLGRSLFMLWAVRRFDPVNYRNMARISIWLVASGVFWLAGGLSPEPARTLLWLIALTLDFASPALGFFVPGLGRSLTVEWSIDSYHLADRCAGFILIALGETILITGETFYELRWTVADGSAFLAAFAGIVALWWIYFDKAAEHTADAFARSDDPGRIARAAYTYAHGLLVAGIIIMAAGDYFLLHTPDTETSLAFGLTIIGGPALFLLGNGVFRRLIYPRFPGSHIWGLLLFGAVAVVSPFLSLLALAWAVCFVLAAVIISSDMLLHRQDPRP
jgi:low temperature requirement protein LtrA